MTQVKSETSKSAKTDIQEFRPALLVKSDSFGLFSASRLPPSKFLLEGLHRLFMEREIIVEQLRKKRKIVILTFALLIVAFLENTYLNCWQIYAPVCCELGWIYVILAVILLLVAYFYRK